MRWTRIVAALALLLVVALAAVLIALNSIDWSQYQEPVVDAVRAATGRELAVDGELRLHIGLHPGVVVEGVRFQNAEWGSKPDMVSVGRFEVQLALWPLLFGRVEIARIVLSDVDVLIETAENSRANYEFEPPTPDATTGGVASGLPSDSIPEPVPAESQAAADATDEAPPAEILGLIRELVIENAVLVQRDGVTGDRLEVEIVRLSARMDDIDSPLRLELDARYNGEPIAAHAVIGGAGRLLAGGAIDLDLAVETGGAQLKLSGPIAQPLEGREFSLKLEVGGDRLDGFSGLAGSDLPALGPYSLAAHLSDDEKRYRIDSLELKVGESVLRGNVVADLGGERPVVEAVLESPLLRAADFDGTRGGASGKGSEMASASAAGSAPPSEPEDSGGGGSRTRTSTSSGDGGSGGTAATASADARLFSDDPLPLDGLAAVDAKVDLRIAHLISGAVELRAVQVGLSLVDRVLAIEPLRAELLGGAIDAGVDLDARRASPVVAIHADVDQIDSGKALEVFEISDALSGARIDAVTRLRGSGTSVRRIMASLAGDLSVQMGSGEISRKWAEAQLGQWAPLVIGKKGSKQKPTLNCAIVRFEVKGGVARARGIAVDLPLLAVVGDGRVDLRDETIDLDLEPIVKEADADLVTPPGRVSGTLAEPEFGLDQEALANKAIDIAVRLIEGKKIASGVDLHTSRGIAGCEELIEKARKQGKSKSSKSSQKQAKKKLKKAKKKLEKKGGKAIEGALQDLLGR